MTDLGDVLTSLDPEPAPGTGVTDGVSRAWSRDSDGWTNPNGAANWTQDDVDNGDPESWTYVAGNFGPVRVTYMPEAGDLADTP